MNKFLQIALVMLCVLSITSCKDDKDDSSDVAKQIYKAKQYAAFEAMADSSDYVKWNNEGGSLYVYAKKIKSGDGLQVYFNSRVSVYYTGTLTDGSQFDSQQLLDGAPFKCAVSSTYANTTYSSVITGWTVALQNMREGDIYEVWIPQELAYGANEKTDSKGVVTIPAYSTLIFQMEVVKVNEQAVAAS